MNPPDNIQRTAPSWAASFTGWKINKYSLLASVYFFFNSLFLPKGLLYTHLLGPFFFINAMKAGMRTFAKPFFILLCAYDIVHLMNGVQLKPFVISNILFVLTYFSVVGISYFISHYDKLGRIFRQILVLNTILLFIAIPFFFLPRHLQSLFWYHNLLTKGVRDFPRLAMLTYEASYYALLLVPVVYYYLLKFFTGDIKHNKWTTLFMAVIPLVLSLSFGVLGATAIVAVLLCIRYYRRLLRYRRFFMISFGLIAVILASLLILYLYYPKNPLFIRIQNIISGSDTSARGRTVESFTLAWRVAQARSVWLGAGLGQVKVHTAQIVPVYYKGWGAFPRYDIPNAMGETLAIFGLTGILLRFGLQVWLFFRTRVASNYYRLSLFLFIFIYQFTGSFIINIAEFVIWILAFSPVFPQFNTSTRPAVSLREAPEKA